ncbi:Glycosyltransferase [Ignavibacterium album JCM 16511]|uniref:Glycosyltransferase n=1 Tax=Ignavibacterium album (strain DSM 19864 / JCM 16511 / NBRC 101810 / Mat9-16) TaxID=945713 RepID=I0AG18_IGNAJ|nr:glycosyltransferase family 4 protein [Ignavibacterium album]AFH47925.1 Glycosyltransferase [Ignavibacterium album JCM 16511]
MKVLYSCLSKSWGGMEMITLTFVKELLKRNIQVELLCLKESRIHVEACASGIITHPVKASGYFHPFTVIKVGYLIRKGHFSLIHTQASKDLWILVPALRIIKSNIPLFLTKQVGSFIVKKDFLHRFLYNRVTKAFAISRVIKKNLVETTPLDKDKIELVFNGIDTEKFNPANADRKKVRKEFSIADNELLIGMLARFSPGKGHEEFLMATKILSAKFDNLKFIIVGEASRGEDEYAASIKKLVSDYELTNVIFAGFRSDTPDVLSAMDIFVFPSHAEAFGIALAEAHSMALPSVCSNSDGVLDIAVDGETTLLFETKNADDLADKLEVLIKDAQLRERFGVNARKRAKELFDLNVIMQNTIEHYKNSLEG